MSYSLLADLIVAFHVAYVAFVVLGQLVIWIGLIFRWAWVRNTWFRWIHLIMMSVVGLEAVYNITCPLTTLEEHYRHLAGQEMSQESFLGRLLHDLIFVQWSPWTINLVHISFALLVLGTFVLAPPRRAGLMVILWAVTSVLFLIGRWYLWPDFPQRGVLFWILIVGVIVLARWGLNLVFSSGQPRALGHGEAGVP